EPRNGPFRASADRVFRRRILPRTGADFTIREADFARFLVKLFDPNFQLLPNFYDFARMLHAIPAQLADMDETVHTAKIDKRAEVFQTANDAFANLAGSQLGE